MSTLDKKKVIQQLATEYHRMFIECEKCRHEIKNYSVGSELRDEARRDWLNAKGKRAGVRMAANVIGVWDEVETEAAMLGDI